MDYYNIGQGKPLLYLHGFNMHPLSHPLYIKLMSKDNEIIAPIFSTAKPQPCNLEDYIDKTYDFLFKHNLTEYNVAGYSLGGGIAFGLANQQNYPDKIIGISPLMSTSYGMMGYIKRGLNMLKNEINQMDCENYERKWGFIKTFAKNLIRHPYTSYKTIQDIANYDSSTLLIGQPVQLMMFSDDEFFNPSEIDIDSLDNFLQLDLCYIKGITHDWDDAVVEISRKNKRFLNDG